MLDDPFRRLNYRRLIAWPQRIQREWPFLSWAIEKAPHRSVVDLGCGTGEHSRFLASQGFTVLGIDISPAQITKARELEETGADSGPHFLEGDFVRLGDFTEERFGAALCLGNVLPYLDDDALGCFLESLQPRLLPGARLIVQLLNYQRIRDQKIRSLPLNVRPAPEGEAGEIIWLRLMTPVGEKQIMFHPTTLRLHPGEDPPVTVHASREVLLRAWRWCELEPLLQHAGFSLFELFGTMARAPFEPQQSHDLIFVATRH